MMDFQIKRSNRRCHATGRDLRPGEEFISELVAPAGNTDGEFQRHDYCLEAWSGPVDESIGWWRGKIPVADAGKVYWAPPEILREYFNRLIQSPDHQAMAWVMAMLLVRKKLMRLDGEETDVSGQRWLLVSDGDHNQEFRLAVVPLTFEQQQSIQQEFVEQLFTDQSPVQA